LTSNLLAPGCEAAGPLSGDEVNFYHREGYLVLRDLFAPREVAELAADVERVRIAMPELAHPDNMRARFKPHYETHESLFEVFDPISDLSPVARRIAHDERILAALQCLYGEPAELFKEKLIYKPPGALGATLHQDWIAWPGFPKTFLTVLLAIDPFTRECGATEVFPRIHQQGYLSPEDGQHHYLELKDLPIEPVPLLLNPGDIAIFGCFAPHRSAPNETSQTRRGYFLSYNARSDGGQQYARHYEEYHAWIRAKTPAEKSARLYFA
jgi:ectoine hydroxylase-related dioxygenase (phytanoyl-CoA dioxygenase family)